MNQFFQICINVEQVKKLFRELAKEFHPDHGGNDEDMKELNKQYHEILAKFHGSKSFKDGKEFTYYYNEPMESELAFTVYRLLGLKMINVDVSLVGLWVWIEGNTREYKESLKGIGCRWHGKRQAWYFRSQKLKTQYNPKISLNGLKQVYGYQECVGEGIAHFDK